MSNINWTIIIFAGLALVGTWLFVPSPLQKCPEVINTSLNGRDSIVVVHTEIPVPADSNIHIGIKKKVKPKVKPPIIDSQSIAIPMYVSEEIHDTTKDGTIVNIRATTYMEFENDSLATYTDIEWKIQPKPMVVDTVYKYLPQAMQEVEVPFIERPIVVMAATILTVTVLLAIFANATK